MRYLALTAAAILAATPAFAQAAMGALVFDWTVSLGLLLALGNIIFTFFRTRRKAVEDQFTVVKSGIDAKFEQVEDRFAEGSKRMDRHDLRLQSLEQSVHNMPGREDLHRVEMLMAEMGGNMKEIRAVMEGNGAIMARLEQVVTRHEEHLLDGGKR
ncbi:DUF2730 family protein [Maritimibacter sp. HL-12]|uniref:DUF2730 family protein n=1 Tax=Maritimibacter sp. HL-12 TaxID=1162418 RepID=UPI000A0F026A|nr:DUF2730 family protein [Maritimibacter sp. HL-12]SMH35952.1 Protein of unknown function [Maritimibacter sp. HL-12]